MSGVFKKKRRLIQPLSHLARIPLTVSLNKTDSLEERVSDLYGSVGSVAGGIAGTRNNVLAAEPLIASGEALRDTVCQRPWGFLMPPILITSLTLSDPN